LRVPRHRGTTAHVCSAYPFLAEPGLGARGVYIGTNVLTGGGGFAYDPFTAYGDGILTNPNVIVAGDVGMGKSTAVKCFVHRSVAMFGRWVAIADPKGEYLPLAETLGLTVLELHPGGTTRLNPLDPGPLGGTVATDEVARRQGDLVAALIGEVLHRDLEPIEDALLGWTLTHLAQQRASEVPTLADVVRVMRTPPAEVADRATISPDELARAAAPAIYALGKLIDRSLRGMFDGPTTVRVDPGGPGLVVDLSAVFQDREALGLVLLAVTAWLQAAITQPTGPRRLQILDEAWTLFGNERTARYLQSCWKLSRAYGVADAHVVGGDDEIDGGAAGTAAVAVPQLDATATGEDAHRWRATGLRTVARVGTGPGRAGTAPEVGPEQVIGEHGEVDAIEDRVAVVAHDPEPASRGPIGVSVVMRAFVSLNACSALPTTCCTTAVRPATFHNARPRVRRVSRSASTPVRPRSSRASGAWSGA
jgi:hypothetical protein